MLSQIYWGPQVQWQKETWLPNSLADGSAVTQNNSGQDVIKSLQPIYVSGVITGYIAAGYSNTINFESPVTLNCGTCLGHELNCQNFEKDLAGTSNDRIIGCSRAKLVKYDLLGNVVWYKTYGIGKTCYFNNVIQTSTGGFLAVGKIIYDGDPVDGGTDEDNIPFNPGTTNTSVGCNDGFPDPADESLEHIFLANIDASGDLIATTFAPLGMATYANVATAEEARRIKAEGFDLYEDPTGDFYIIGLSGNPNKGDKTHAFVVRINPELDIDWKRPYLDDENFISYAKSGFGETGKLWVAAVQGEVAGDELTGDVETRVHLLRIDPSDGSLFSGGDYEITPSIDPDIETVPAGGGIRVCDVYEIFNNDGNIIVPVIINKQQPWFNYGGIGTGKIHTFTISSNSFSTSSINLGSIKNSELKICSWKRSTSNDYYIAFSKQTTLLADVNDVAGSVNGVACEYDAEYWNTDIYVQKYSSSSSLIWGYNYPITTYQGGVYPYVYPYDVSRRELVSGICETPDGGVLIAGYRSTNVYDDLIMKLYDDCNSSTPFVTGDINSVYYAYNVWGAETWNTSRKVRGVVIVNNGCSLTIADGAVIEFDNVKYCSRPTYILVKRGGKLIIANTARLSGLSSCNTMWDGVYVEGTYNVSHPSYASIASGTYPTTGSAHGLIWVKSGGIVEQSLNGLCAFYPSSVPDYSKGGGIIIAEDAVLKNNKIAVQFQRFSKVNLSGFRHCDFITDAALWEEDEKFTEFVSLAEVNGVKFRGNDFQNSTILTVPGNTDGSGIVGFASKFVVDNNPNPFGATGGTGSDPNTFNKMNYAISASSIYTLAPANVTIKGNTFTNNNRNIYVGVADLATINFNTINMQTGNTYGIYVDATTAYGIEENIISLSGPAVKKGIGIILNENGTSNNVIYRNTFTNLKRAINAQGNNGNTTSGVVFKCNTFTGNERDISVLNSGGITGSIKADQGVCLGTSAGYLKSPANNLFTDPSLVISNGQLFASSGVATINYTFHEDNLPLLDPYAQPSQLSTNYDLAPIGTGTSGCVGATFNLADFDLVYCPTNYPSGGGGGGLRLLGNTIKNFNYLQSNVLASVKQTGDGEDSLSAFEYDILRNLVLRQYLQENETDSAETILESDSSLLAQSVLTQLAVADGNYAEANTYVNNIEEDTSADAEGYSADINGIALYLDKYKKSWQQISDDDLTLIESIAGNEDKEAIHAKLILEFVEGIPYEEPIVDDEDTGIDEERSLSTHFSPSGVNTISIYPNPVGENSLAFIRLEKANAGQTEFIIYEINGKVVKVFKMAYEENIIELNNKIFSPGIYIARLSCNDWFNSNTQFVVIK